MADLPLWTSDQLALLGDGRLTGDARTIGLLLSIAGDDGLSYGDLEGLLPDASRDRLRKAITKLDRCKWIIRQVGGRGHGDRFALLASSESASYTGIRLAILDTLSDTLPETSTLRGHSLPKPSTLRPPSSSSYLPPPPPLSAQTRELVESSLGLRDCRDNLIAYLELGRSERPDAYVRSVEGAVHGNREELWRDSRGNRLAEDRAKIVAGCLDDLAQCDEVGKYFGHPPGDFNNLAQKIRYRVKTVLGAKHDGAHSRTASGKTRRESGNRTGRTHRSHHDFATE